MARASAKSRPATAAVDVAPSGSDLALASSETRDRLGAMAAIAARMKGNRPAREVLTRVRGVRTIFPQLDAATGIGCVPIQRIIVIHGPSNHGKTLGGIGLGKSFLLGSHFFKLVDAEHTTPIDWCAQMGLPIDPAKDPRAIGFSAIRPASYEETVDVIQSWAESIGNAKARGELPPDVTGLVLVDSLKKLTPKALLQRLLKEGADDEGEKRSGGRPRSKRGLDGMNGAAARYKAALNNQWMDSLVPLLAQTGTAVALIAREYERQDDGDDFLTRDEDYVIGGGRGVVFDSSLRMRIVLEGEIWEGEGSARRTLGQRHRIEIRKTKIAKKTDRVPVAHFHTSNGALVPEGFDTQRDLLELAQEMGLVEESGARYRFGRREIGHGRQAAVTRLHRDPDLFADLDARVRAEIETRLSGERQVRGLI